MVERRETGLDTERNLERGLKEGEGSKSKREKSPYSRNQERRVTLGDKDDTDRGTD